MQLSTLSVEGDSPNDLSSPGGISFATYGYRTTGVKSLQTAPTSLKNRDQDGMLMRGRSNGLSQASPAGRLHARILTSVAEYETEVRAERVAAGQAASSRKFIVLPFVQVKECVSRHDPYGMCVVINILFSQHI